MEPSTGHDRRIGLLPAGGTFDVRTEHRLDLVSYSERGSRLSTEELLARVPELVQIAEVIEVPFERRRSSSMTPADWVSLHDVIVKAVEGEGLDGLVVTHGTGTLEEAAYFLSLTLRVNVPVVVTGAMRPPDAIGTDTYTNLLSAMRVAASPQAAGMGVMVVSLDAIHAARTVTKAATSGLSALSSREIGLLGRVDVDGAVLFYRRETRRHTMQSEFRLGEATLMPRVDVVLSYAGQDGVHIDACVAAGAAGIVSAGQGAGRCTDAENEALDRAIHAGVVVVQSSRTGSGRVMLTESMRRRGIIAGDDLASWKARVLLMLALQAKATPDRIQQMFLEY